MSTARARDCNEALDFEIEFSYPTHYHVTAIIKGFSRRSQTGYRKNLFRMEAEKLGSRCDAMKDLETMCYRKWAKPAKKTHR